jgi:LacI family transcriptional regulator
MGITLKDIAKELKLSTTTISKALQDYPDISTKTKKKVYEYVKKVGYQPSAQAAYLRTKKTKLIGLIIPSTENQFFIEVISGIISEAEKNDYSVIVTISNESQEREKKLIQTLLNRKVDGILMSLTAETVDLSPVQEIMNTKTSLILFDRISKLIDCSKVHIDDKKMGALATEHLIQKGCKKIANLRGRLIPQNSIDRFLGYKSTLEKYQLDFDPSRVAISQNSSIEDGYELTKKLFEHNIELDSLVCFTDPLAIGALKYINEKKIPIPSRIKLVGFGNTLMGSLTNPSITSINQDAVLMGEKAVQLFLREQNDRKLNKNLSFKTIVLKTDLIERETSK